MLLATRELTFQQNLLPILLPGQGNEARPLRGSSVRPRSCGRGQRGSSSDAIPILPEGSVPKVDGLCSSFPACTVSSCPEQGLSPGPVLSSNNHGRPTANAVGEDERLARFPGCLQAGLHPERAQGQVRIARCREPPRQRCSSRERGFRVPIAGTTRLGDRLARRLQVQERLQECPLHGVVESGNRFDRAVTVSVKERIWLSSFPPLPVRTSYRR